ncbi:MAG: acetolactate decarboxylase, partial [Leuconostoc falkenbergense]
RDVQGTLVGYYAPAVFGGATAAGWHLHFLADDHQFAGHVLDFEADDMVGSLLIFDEFEQHLPIDNHDFRAMKQDMAGLQDGIEASEGGRK